MSLLDTFNKTKKDFDPKKDNINGSYDKLPAGEYNVTMDNVDHFVSKKTGFEQLSFKMVVIDGKHASQSELVGVNLDDKKKDGSPMPEFVVSKNLKTLMKIASLVGLEITDEMIMGNVTDIYEKLFDAFEPYRGKLMVMKITESPNKKDPDNPYRNYEFEPYDNQENNSNDEIKVEDDDLPF